MIYVVKTKFNPNGKQVIVETEKNTEAEARAYKKFLEKKGWTVDRNIWKRGGL